MKTRSVNKPRSKRSRLVLSLVALVCRKQLERHVFPGTKLLRVGVLLEELKPFDGSFDEKARVMKSKLTLTVRSRL